MEQETPRKDPQVILGTLPFVRYAVEQAQRIGAALLELSRAMQIETQVALLDLGYTKEERMELASQFAEMVRRDGIVTSRWPQESLSRCLAPGVLQSFFYWLLSGSGEREGAEQVTHELLREQAFYVVARERYFLDREGEALLPIEEALFPHLAFYLGKRPYGRTATGYGRGTGDGETLESDDPHVSQMPADERGTRPRGTGGIPSRRTRRSPGRVGVRYARAMPEP